MRESVRSRAKVSAHAQKFKFLNGRMRRREREFSNLNSNSNSFKNAIMTKSLKIVARNAPQRMNEVKMFILNNNVDIMLISEGNLTKKYYFKIPSYSIYHTTHAESTAHSDIAIIIESNTWHHELGNFKNNFLQITKN